MKRSRIVFLGIGSALLVTLLGIPQTTQAGPPLICHPLDIRGAKSLPWIGGDRPSGADWRGVDPKLQPWSARRGYARASHSGYAGPRPNGDHAPSHGVRRLGHERPESRIQREG